MRTCSKDVAAPLDDSLSLMDARQLRYFLAVVDEGSAHAAAKTLFVSQPSVSQALRALERDAQAELFSRTGRKLVLTAAGEALIAPARQVLHWLELSQAHVDAVNGLQTGRLTLATMPSQAVEPLTSIIHRFTVRYPMVQASIRAAGTPADVLSQVRTGTVDLGVMAVFEVSHEGGLVMHRIARQRFIVVAPPASPLAESDAVTYAHLEGQRLIVGQPGTGMRRMADQVIAANRSSVLAVETEHREAILPMVLAGTGIAIMSDAWREMGRAAGLQVHDLVTDEHLEIVIAHRAGELSPAAQAFLMMTLPTRQF